MIPKLRFPEFTDVWTQENLGNIYSQIRNGFVGTATPFYVSKGHKYVQGKDVKNGTINNTVNVYVSDDFHLKNRKSILKVNDIVMVQSGHVGECAVVDEKIAGANCHALIVMSPSKPAESRFYVYYFYSSYGKNEILKVKTGNTIEHILASDMKAMLVPYCSTEEQQKVADFLTSVDKETESINKKVELLKQYKKSVMQKIFTQQIRFKDEGGNDYPDWNEMKLSELGNTYSGLTGKTKDDFGVGEPYITYKQIFDSSEIDSKKFSKVRMLPTEKQNTSQFGDIFFTTSSETPEEVGFASVQLTNDIAYLNSFCFGYRPNNLDELIPQFAKYLFRSDIFRRHMYKLAQGSTRYNISKVGFMKTIVELPCRDEQQKIADFLSTIDDKIKAEETKLASAKKFKKALLQRMFI